MIPEAFGMGPGGGGGGGGMVALLYFGLLILIFYFFFIRPQQRKHKQQQKMLSELKKGDRVVTNSGMFGTIVGFDEKENLVVLKVGENIKLEFLRSAIAGRVEKGESTPKN